MNYTQAIQDLLAKYAFYADRRQAQKQVNLFNNHQITEVYFPGADVQVIESKSDLLAGFEALRQYDKTFHQVGQSLITLTSDTQAKGTVYTIAHHWTGTDLLIMYIRYEDDYVLNDSDWKFAKRELHIEFVENRQQS